MQMITLTILCVFYISQVYGCEVTGKFDMPYMFKRGDIMIGGIFPVFNKEISTTTTFVKEPLEAICQG